MNSNDTIKLLEQLGIRTENTGDKVKFYDIDTDILMEIYEIKKKEMPKSKLEEPNFFTLYSPLIHKMVRIHYSKPIINVPEKDSLVVTRAHICDENGEYIVDLDSSRSINGHIHFCSYSEDLLSNTDLKIYKDNRISFDVFGKYGCFDNEFDEGYELTNEEILDSLTNKNLELFLDYYKKLYPEFKKTVETAKEKAGITKIR